MSRGCLEAGMFVRILRYVAMGGACRRYAHGWMQGGGVYLPSGVSNSFLSLGIAAKMQHERALHVHPSVSIPLLWPDLAMAVHKIQPVSILCQQQSVLSVCILYSHMLHRCEFRSSAVPDCGCSRLRCAAGASDSFVSARQQCIVVQACRHARSTDYRVRSRLCRFVQPAARAARARARRARPRA